jgi:hypothetical protein
MQTPISIIIVFIACPIVVLLFVVRLLAAPFSSKVANQMKKHPFIHIIWACFALVGVLAVIGGINPSSLTGRTRGRYMRAQEHYAEAFKAGDTNVPLLEMDWFAPTVHFCRVSQTGKGSARRDVGHAIQAGVSISLDETNLQALVETINHLPTPPKSSLPVERQIVVGCIRSNQWFRAVYDRANIPHELEKISEITGAYLPWFVPEAQGYPAAISKQEKFLCMAIDAPIVISAHDEADGVHAIHPVLHIWDISGWRDKIISESSLISEWANQWGSVIASQDGSVIAIVGFKNVYAVNWKTAKLLWQAPLPERTGHWITKSIAIGGEHEQFLFAAGTYQIERWDMLTGASLAVLVTNEDVSFVSTSKNGGIFVAGYGGKLGVWQSEKDNPVLEITNFTEKLVGMSNDGKLLALTTFGRSGIDLLDWKTGSRSDVPLRNSQNIYSVCWSPDDKRLAVYSDATYPASILIYDTASWKPIAHWNCGQIGQGSEFSFGSNGTLYQIRNNELNALDVSRLKSIGED